MVNLKNINILRKNFSTNPKRQAKKAALYGYALRDKFSDICQSDLVGKVLNKSENDVMLLRSTTIDTSHVGNKYSVYNGLIKEVLEIRAIMVGFRVGEFIFPRKVRNLITKNSSGGRKRHHRMNKEKLEIKKDLLDLRNKNYSVSKTLYSDY